MKNIITGLPVAGAVIISVFSWLHRKTNTQGREDTRSGHILFPTISPCTNIFSYLAQFVMLLVFAHSANPIY